MRCSQNRWRENREHEGDFHRGRSLAVAILRAARMQNDLPDESGKLRKKS